LFQETPPPPATSPRDLSQIRDKQVDPPNWFGIAGRKIQPVHIGNLGDLGPKALEVVPRLFFEAAGKSLLL